MDQDHWERMLQAHLNQLAPLFREKVEILAHRCLKKGVRMAPNESLRDPLLQGKYWRRSRQQPEVDKKILELKSLGAGFLAECIELAGNQQGPLVTNAVPGMSWHQWGEAIDFLWMENNRVIWDAQTLIEGRNGYHIYGEEARRLGLDCGLYWSGIVDACHVQFRPTPNPSALYSLEQINKEMQLRFGSMIDKLSGKAY